MSPDDKHSVNPERVPRALGPRYVGERGAVTARPGVGNHCRTFRPPHRRNAPPFVSPLPVFRRRVSQQDGPVVNPRARRSSRGEWGTALPPRMRARTRERKWRAFGAARVPGDIEVRLAGRGSPRPGACAMTIVRGRVTLDPAAIPRVRARARDKRGGLIRRAPSSRRRSLKFVHWVTARQRAHASRAHAHERPPMETPDAPPRGAVSRFPARATSRRESRR
jgi:hypothetical protein